ncbi:MAG: hypothetical protein R3B09_23055 [Nannocystaceae bacterium]
MILWILWIFGVLGERGAIAAGDPVGLVIAILTLLFFFGLVIYFVVLALARALGGPLARWVAIPFGLDRAAGLLARESLEWQRDPKGGALLCGALALLHRPRHDEAIATRLAAELAAVKDIGAAGVIASGLLAASRGDRDGARELLVGALDLEMSRTPPAARTIASEWLIADAVHQGAWAQAVKLAEEPGVSLSARARLLVGVASRFAGTHGPTDAGLWILWALAGRHAATRPLLDRALATPRVLHRRRQDAPPPPPPPPVVDDEPELPSDPLARALTLHAHWTARDPIHLRLHPARLGALCRAWDEVWQQAAVRTLVEARAAHLGVLGKGEAIADDFFAEVVEDLAALSEECGVAIAEAIAAERRKGAAATDEDGPREAEDALLGAISGRAVAHLRSRLLGEVEAAAETMESRTKSERALPSVEEWKEWTRLRQIYERAGQLGGLELRRLMFPQVHRSACNFAVWLWNERKEYGVSKPIFRWLLTEAEAVGDEQAIELQKRNVGVN